MPIIELLNSFEEEVLDVEEETFFLFSQEIPSQNLGFVDPKASELEITVAGRDFTIRQSPAVLSSNREGGTTGAVLWKITPLFAAWLASPSNPFLRPRSVILELGCGISALTALAAAPRVRRYVLSDQLYVSKLVHQNLEENRILPKTQSRKGRAKATKPTASGGEIHFRPLDWELDVVTSALASSSPSSSSSKNGSFDTIVACDCIYNEALVAPFVQTCADACRLREEETQRPHIGREAGVNNDGDVDDGRDDDDAEGGGGGREPCVCIVAQQLRSSDVFEAWLREFNRYFRVWRVPDTTLREEGLHVGTGFVVHVGILRGQGVRR